MKIEFTIPGKPVGKGRPRFAKRGNFVRAYTPAETVGYENLVKMAASYAMGDRPPSINAHEIGIRINVVPPKSWSQKKQLNALDGIIFPTVKPDSDNVLKIICDACNGIVWRDDAQVVDCTVIKRYGEMPFVSVTIREL